VQSNPSFFSLNSFSIGTCFSGKSNNDNNDNDENDDENDDDNDDDNDDSDNTNLWLQ
jgi:hypothetical protein